jgi:hypothetical protein
MRLSVSRSARWLLLLVGVAACGPVAASSTQAPATAPPPAEPAAASVSAPGPAILSAHLARVDDPELGGKDGVIVVLDTEVDPISLHPRAFVVIRRDAGPTFPERALLAPASEADEHRTVLLVGELHEHASESGGTGESEGTGDAPTHVAVIGPLWAEDGRSLRGLGAPVSPFAAGLVAVAAEVLAAAPGRCEGAAQLVRTYWSDELRGVDPSDLARVRIVVREGAALAPSRFDDHAADHGEAGQDNVLDLCLDDAAPPRRVSIDAGAFHDPAGHPSVAVELVPTEPKVAPPIAAPAPAEPAPAEPAR